MPTIEGYSLFRNTIIEKNNWCKFMQFQTMTFNNGICIGKTIN